MKKLAYALICSTALVTVTMMPQGSLGRFYCWMFAGVFGLCAMLTNEKS